MIELINYKEDIRFLISQDDHQIIEDVKAIDDVIYTIYSQHELTFLYALYKREIQPCPICKSPAILNDTSSYDRFNVLCTRCGRYEIDRTAYIMYSSREPNFNLSSAIARKEINDCIDSRHWNVAPIYNLGIFEKIDLILKYISNNYSIKYNEIAICNTVKNLSQNEIEPYSDYMEILLNFNLNRICAYAYIEDVKELIYLLSNYLTKEKDYLQFHFQTGSLGYYQITPKGWDYIESRKDRSVDSNSVFIAMWFNDLMIPIREKIKEAVVKSGFDPIIVDEQEHCDNINDKIISDIRKAKFMVADFTGQRGGVYFESGFAKGLNIPVVWTCEDSELENIHFDTSHYNFILWNRDTLDEFAEKLKNRITSVIGWGKNVNELE